MDLELSDDQRELAQVARGLLDRHAPIALARAELDGGGDHRALWAAIAEGGWYRIGLEEDDPFGVPGLCLLARECGAHVAPNLLADTAVALRLTADAEAGDTIQRLRSGEAAVTLAALEPGSDWTLEGLETSLSEVAGELRLHGRKVGVAHADRADLLLVLAEEAGALTAALVSPGADGLRIGAPSGIDPSSRTCAVECDGVAVPRSATVRVTRGTLSDASATGALAAAAEGLGAAHRALDESIAYALERHQFGRPIGQFQALQHVLADAHVLRETAWSTTLYAAAAFGEGTPDAADAVAVAKAHASRAAREVVEAAAQVFGGVAFTWEHDLHLYQRRVLASEQRFGDSRHHEAQLGDRIAQVPAMVGP